MRVLSLIKHYSLFAALFFVTMASACGYAIHGAYDLPFRSVTVGNIINKTLEPGLGDRLRLALSDELSRSGLSVENNAGHKISGTIKTFELRTISEKSGTTSEYEVVISGDFILTDSSGRSRPLRGSGLYIVSFLSTDRLEGVMALKEKATEKALKDLAAEMTASIIYQ